MNSDFHYYATYYAAIWAGFDEYEAESIAWAAEMVDELGANLAKKHASDLGDNYLLTVQKDGFELAKDMQISDDPNTPKHQGIRSIWMPFHFLPGHFKDGYSTIKEKERIKFDSLDVDKESKHPIAYIDSCMRLRCKRNSETVRRMLKYVKDKYVDDPILCGKQEMSTYYLIGIAMHVLADTWAHENFCGLHSYMVNSVRFTAAEYNKRLDDDVAKSYLYCFLTDIGDWFNILGISDDMGATGKIGIKSENSAAFLGHGQIFHAPDYDFFSYRYYPRYLCPNENVCKFIENSSVHVSNPRRFEEAILGMNNAMCYIRSKDIASYDPKYKELFGKTAEEVKNKVFKVLPKNQNKVMSYGEFHEMIVKDKENQWIEYLKKQNYEPVKFDIEKGGDISLFAREAKKYRNMILNYIYSRLDEEIVKDGGEVILKYDLDKIEEWMK